MLKEKKIIKEKKQKEKKDVYTSNRNAFRKNWAKVTDFMYASVF